MERSERLEKRSVGRSNRLERCRRQATPGIDEGCSRKAPQQHHRDTVVKDCHTLHKSSWSMIRPPREPFEGGVTSSPPKPPLLEIGESWRCLENVTYSQDDDSDASCDMEVASLTYGRRLGMEYVDACLPAGPSNASTVGWLPAANSKRETAESMDSPGLLSLLNPVTTAPTFCSVTPGFRIDHNARGLEERGSLWGDPAGLLRVIGDKQVEHACGRLPKERQTKRRRTNLEVSDSGI